jgi:hypothetical protein
MKGGNQTIIEWCLANGATSTQFNTALMEVCVAAGTTQPALPDALYELLTAQGYTGSLADMWAQHVAAGLPDLGGGATAYDLTVGSFSSLRGYDGVTYMFGSLSSTDFDDLGSTITIQKVYAAISDQMYLYLSVGGDRTGQTVEFATAGFNGGTPIVLTGQAGGHFQSGTETGLNAYLDSELGNTIAITLERTA